MKNYCSIFIQLSLQQCTVDDYLDKSKVKINNLSLRKLEKLKNEMKKECKEEIYSLLLNEDDRVKINAAQLCFQMNILVDKATKVLKNIIENSTDETIRFSAKMNFKHYKSN